MSFFGFSPLFQERLLYIYQKSLFNILYKYVKAISAIYEYAPDKVGRELSG